LLELSKNLQVGIIATRRPELLERTLRSFNENLFRHFNISASYANLDPAFGDAKCHKKAIDCIRYFLPNCKIREPEKPSFGGAVKWLWGEFQPGLALHLEDDWELMCNLYPDDVYSQLRKGFSAVSLCGNNRNWLHRRNYLYINEPRQKFPFIGKTKKPVLGTQPKFIEGGFANQISTLIDPEKDPEKQMLPNAGQKFSELLKSNRCGFLKKSGSRQYGVLRELGRDWRNRNNINKILRDGVSIWEKS